jgi:integrase
VPVQRDAAGLEIKRAGRVVAGPGPSLPYVLVDDAGAEVAGVSEFLRHMTACDLGRLSVRSYALALQRWLRFLDAAGVAWERAERAEVRDFVLWMRSASPARARRADGAAGGLNPRTGKRYLGDHFAPATINHNLAVVSAFYEFCRETGTGPLVNPVPPRGSGRVHAHHNPLDPFVQPQRAPYRQRVPQAEPRAMPDALFDELFTSMGSDRDRAILAFYISTGARPSELMGVRCAQVDYGEQMIAVERKGTRAVQWLPASPDAFVWLRLYQQDLPAGRLTGDQPAWQTLRRPFRGLDYEAMRAVLRRANTALGTNWTLHDLRHTFAVRMANDPKMPLVTVQVLLGHVHLATTQRYLRPHLEQVIAHARDHHQRQAADEPAQPAGPLLGYDGQDLAVLAGWQLPPQAGP